MSNHKHGYHSSPLYAVLADIKRRCNNKNRPDYARYGGRGINICEEWANNPKEFVDWALSNGWGKGLQIDRKDNDGNYEPSNCRIVTCRLNSENRRDNNKFIGVHWDRLNNRWKAQRSLENLKPHHKRYLGLFKTHLAACYARHVANLEQVEGL